MLSVPSWKSGISKLNVPVDCCAGFEVDGAVKMFFWDFTAANGDRESGRAWTAEAFAVGPIIACGENR